MPQTFRIKILVAADFKSKVTELSILLTKLAVCMKWLSRHWVCSIWLYMSKYMNKYDWPGFKQNGWEWGLKYISSKKKGELFFWKGQSLPLTLFYSSVWLLNYWGSIPHTLQPSPGSERAAGWLVHLLCSPWKFITAQEVFRLVIWIKGEIWAKKYEGKWLRTPKCLVYARQNY